MTEDAYTKKFYGDYITRETLVESEYLTKEEAMKISDEDMQAIAEGFVSAAFDGEDWNEAMEEMVAEYKQEKCSTCGEPVDTDQDIHRQIEVKTGLWHACQGRKP